MPSTTTALLVPAIAGGFTVLGVLLKMGYDALIERGQRKRQRIERFAPERREAFEAFLRILRLERDYWEELHKLALKQRQGEDVPPETLQSFPQSPMGDLVDALGAVRRLARTYQVISAAEGIIRLFVDMAAAERAAISEPGPDDDIKWFLLQRFMDDREKEFVHAYRQDLGLGAPEGGPRDYPLPKRPWPLPVAERNLRTHIQKAQPRGDQES